MRNQIVQFKLDKDTSDNLDKLSEFESRTKIDEVRFLIKQRAAVLGVKIK